MDSKKIQPKNRSPFLMYAFGSIILGTMLMTPNNAADIVYFLLTVSIGVATHIGMEQLAKCLITETSSDWAVKVKTAIVNSATVAIMYCCLLVVTDRFVGHNAEVNHLEHVKELIKIVIVVYLMSRFFDSQYGSKQLAGASSKSISGENP